VLCVPRKALGLDRSRSRLAFNFKWADKLAEQPEVMDFYSKGDVAPDARFNYRFVAP
jgi:hypothetical protein